MDKPEESRGSAGRVLLVDDNDAMRGLMAAALAAEGFAVDTARDVPSARRMLGTAAILYDLVLSDIRMPGESGFDLLTWMKSEASGCRDIPVLLTTAALPEAEHRIRGLMMGAVDYVVRPVDLREVALRAAHAIEHHRRVQLLESTLKDSERMFLAGRLLAASSHEIKNLAGIVNVTADQVTRLVESRLTPLSEREGAMVKALRDSTSLLIEVARRVSGLLAPDRADEGDTVDLSTLVPEVLTFMQPRLRPIMLYADPGSRTRPCFVRGHPVRLKQVIVNLLLNAGDAIHELAPPEGATIQVAWGQEEGQAWLTIEDQGIGFATSGVRTEFAPFATTKKLRGGHGLGLWLCSSLLEGMGGTLTLSSQGVGQGVTARIDLVGAPQDSCDEDLRREVEAYLNDSWVVGESRSL